MIHEIVKLLPSVLVAFIFPLMILAFYLKSKTKGAIIGFFQGLIMPIGSWYGSGKIEFFAIVFFVSSVLAGYFWGLKGEKKKKKI